MNEIYNNHVDCGEKYQYLKCLYITTKYEMHRFKIIYDFWRTRNYFLYFTALLLDAVFFVINNRFNKYIINYKLTKIIN